MFLVLRWTLVEVWGIRQILALRMQKNLKWESHALVLIAIFLSYFKKLASGFAVLTHMCASYYASVISRIRLCAETYCIGFLNPNSIDAYGLKIQGRGYLMLFAKILGGQGFQENAVPLIWVLLHFFFKCFEICLRWVLYLPFPHLTPLCAPMK